MTRLNSGAYFARPFESPYNQYRRFLIANVELPRPLWNSIITDAYPELSSPLVRVQALEPDSSAWPQIGTKHPGFLRQCPECAQAVFHSPFYNYDWLTLCPIHHTPFCDCCPTCHKPWPDATEMEKRDCIMCGSKNCTLLSDAANSISAGDTYWAFHELNKLFQKDKELLYLQDGDNCLDWFVKHDETSMLFPSVKLHKWKNIDPQVLIDRHVHLEPLRSTLSDPLIDILSIENGIDNESHLQSILEDQFRVMTRILAWIKQHSPTGHTAKISSWVNYHAYRCEEKAAPCIFCMALSIWFVYVSSRYHTVHYRHKVKDWDLLYRFNFEDFEIVGQHVHIETQPLDRNETPSRYYLGPNIERWIYRRSLELCFKRIFCLLQNILKALDLIKHTGRRLSYFESVGIEVPFTGLDTFLLREANRVRLLYTSEHPLNDTVVSINDLDLTLIHQANPWDTCWVVKDLDLGQFIALGEQVRQCFNMR